MLGSGKMTEAGFFENWTLPQVLVEEGALPVRVPLQRASYLWCQRFSACFHLKIAPQRGEGEKRKGVQISKNSSQNL